MPGSIKTQAGRSMPKDAREWARLFDRIPLDNLKDGQTDYDTGIGWFLGDHAGTPKFSLGNSAGNKVTWDGSTLTIVGTITATAGTIGGWTLAATYLEAGSGATLVRLDSGGTNPAISAGSATPASAPFRVTQAGALTATSATITGAITATSGSFTGGVTVGTGGSFSSGQTAYDTGVGFWFEHNSGTPRFSFGDSAGASLKWDGATLTITGADGAETVAENLFFKGDDDAHQAIGQLIGSEVSTSNGGNVDEWHVLRTITTNFVGSFRLRVEVREEIGVGADTVDAAWRLKNGAGTVVHTETTDSATYVDTFSDEETVTEAGEVWTLEARSQTDLSTYLVETFIRDVEVRARVDHATIV